MDPFYYPKASPIVEGGPLRYSVGFYRGRSRIVIGWFRDFDNALDFLKRSRRNNPRFKYDVLKSMF